MKILMLKGLQASGKSTAARNLVDKGWVRVNKDELRSMLHNGSFQKGKTEKQILAVRDFIISDALSRNKNVVVDDTNFNPVHEKRFRQLAREFKAEFEIDDSFLSVPLEVCIERDNKRANGVGERVIRDTYWKYIDPPKLKQEVHDDNLQRCFIFDIDGTLAHMTDRTPYEFDKVGSDIADSAVAFIIDAFNNLQANKYVDVILLSGRESTCRQDTIEWLKHWCIDYTSLHMRAKNDMRDDRVIKRELYEQNIKGKYNVMGVFDDRPKVARMWREDLGLKVFQVGDPYYEF